MPSGRNSMMRFATDCSISWSLRRRGGYCPCRLEKTEDNKCICKEFREQMKDPNFEGYCHCMLYYKTKDPIKEEVSHAEDHSDQL